jgi:hypothetical protein
MTYAFIQDVPIDQATYEKVRAGLGDATPKGLISHLVITQESGLRYIDVWETREDWDRFHVDRLQAVVDGVLAEQGITADRSLVRREEIEVIDTWLGVA